MNKAKLQDHLPSHTREVVYAICTRKGFRSRRFEYVSESVGPVLGYNSETFLSRQGLWDSLVHADDLKTLIEGWKSTLESGKEKSISYRMKPKGSSQYIWVEDRLRPDVDSDGRTRGVIGSVVDITERKNAEDYLRDSEARLLSTIENAMLGVYRTTPDGRILMANRSLVEMLGYKSFAELSKRDLNEGKYEPAYPREQFRKQIEKDESVRGFEAEWTRKDGTKISIRENAHVVRDEKGKVIYYEGTVEDISDQKRMEERTANLNKILRLLSRVSKIIMYESDRDDLFQNACDVIVRDGGYLMAWIGLIEEKSPVIRPLVWSGNETGYLRGIMVTSGGRPEGRGPVGMAAKTGAASVCNDTKTDPGFKPWRARALRRGFRSLASFPMSVQGKVVGILSIYSGEKDHFTPEEVRLLSELGDNIGHALWAMEARKKQESADEVIREKEFWLQESQRVAGVGSYIYKFENESWSSSAVLDDLLGIDATFKKDFQSLLALVHPEDRPALLKKIKDSYPGKRQFNAEFRLVRPRDKEVRWMWGTAEVLVDSSGNPARIFGTVQDITERRRTEEELRNERILLRTLVNNLPNSIYVKDRNYRKVLANPSNVRHARMKSDAQVLGKTDFELYPKELAEKFFEDDRRVIEKGESILDREEFIFDENETKRWQLTTKIPLRDDKGMITGLIGIGTDITERKLAEEAKQRERSLLRALIDHLPVSVCVKDRNYRRTVVNKAHINRTALFSDKIHPAEEYFLGKTDFDIYSDNIAKRSFIEDQTVIRDGVTVLDRLEMIVDLNGTKHWQLISKVPLLDEHREIAGLIVIVTDITSQKIAEEALERERKLLRTIIDNLPNAIFVKDKNLRKIVANPSHLDRLSLSTGREITSESQILGKTDFEVYPESTAAGFLAEDQQILREALTVINREKHSTDSDGRERWELVSKIPLRDERGEVIGFVGIASDITDQKRVEEALQRERILLRTIINHIPNGIFAKDREYRKILANPAHVKRVSEHVGVLKTEDLVGKTDFDIYSRELAEQYMEDDRRIINEGKSVLNRPVSEIGPDGVKRWELVSKIPMRDEKGEIIGLVGVATDITPLREAEEKLAESEAKFRLLAENARDVIFRYAFSPSPHFEYISPASLAISGYSPEDLYAEPEPIYKLVHPEDRSVVAEFRKGGDLRDGTLIVRWIRKDGSIIWVEMQNHPIYDEDHYLLAVEGIVRDITERKKSEEAIRSSKEMLARITSSIRDVIYSIDGRTGEFEYISPAFERLLGYSISDISDMGGRWAFLRVVVEGTDPAHKDPVISEMQEKQIESTPVWERWWKCKDGSRLCIEDYSVPIYEDGRLVRIDGVLHDVTERKLAEDEVERERILLRTLIDNVPYSIYVKDRNFRKVIANPVDVQKFAGLSSESDIIGKTDLDVYPKKIAEKLMADDRTVIVEGRTVINREELVIDAAGNEHWLLTTKVPLRDKGNEIIGLVGVGIDVTEKRAVDEALRRSEAELRALFESMNDVVMSIDSQGRYLKIAPTDPELLYRPADEILGKTIFDILPEDTAELCALVIEDTLRSKRTHTVEYMLEIGGEGKWRVANVSPMTDDSVIWVARDITERKMMEKEITESEKKYRELVENALVGVYKMNLSGTIVYANKAMADMLEYDSPQEVMSVSSSVLYKNFEEMRSFIDELRMFGKTGKNKELEFVTRTGKVRNVLLSASLDRDVISGMAKDITDIRTLERQFIQTQKLEGLGNIAAGIAHDFNNILGVILGYSDLLGQSSFEPAKFERGMQAISKAADRGKSLVTQLLTFARKTEVSFESLVLNTAVADIERLVQETFPRTIEIRTSLARTLPPVLADTTQIHQVLLNLCLNARDAMPKGGKLFISTGTVSGPGLSQIHPEATAAKYVKLEVADSGTGMDEATRQRIFEPFFTTKGVGKGTGLGLSVVYGIIESHRGFIDVTSEPGKGTTFKIYLPVVEQQVQTGELANDVAADISSSGGTILIIEDEEMLRELLRSILTSRGYDVIAAKDGEEGLEVFSREKDRIDLVISDLGLPRLSGEEVVSRIKSTSSDTKIAIASGFIDPEVRAELTRKGISNFILKPYRTSEVLRIVYEMLS